MVILAFGLVGQQAQAQCSGCTTTLGTNTAYTFPSTGNKLCITSPTYSQTINFNWLSGANSVCIANGVTFSGGYSNSNNTANIELYGVATTSTSMNFNTGGTLNFTIGSTGVYLGSLSVPNAGITSVAGIFNPVSASLNQSGYSIVITPNGNATIPGGTLVSCAVNNQGNLFLGSGLTLNSASTLTLGGTVVANGPINASSGQILITGNVTFNSGFTSTGTNLTVANGGSLNVNGNLFWNGGGTFSIGGAVNVNGNFQSNSNVAISDGSVNVTGVIQNSGGGFSGSGSGCGYVCGGTLTGWGNWNNGSGLALCKSPIGGSSPGSGVSVYTTTTTSQPTALTVASTTTGFRGTFTVATNTGTNGYIVVRNTGSQPATPTSFRNYVAGTTVAGTTIVAAIITPRTTSSFIDIQPSGCGITNYYAIYAFQNLTSAGTACGSNYYINTLNPATAQLAVGTLGTVGSITGVTTICGAGNLSFSTSTISGATGYIWGYTGQGVTVASTTTSAILTFSSTATSGIVTVAGFSSCGTTSSANLTITVSSAPVVVTQPTNATICGTSTQLFVSSASGTGLSYAWQASSNSGTSWFTLSNSSPYSGVTTATLTVASPPSSISGYQFRNIITAGCASATTSGANLVVVSTPVFTSSPIAATVCGSSNAIFSSTATGGGINYAWFASSNSGTNYFALTNGTPFSGTSLSNLTITGVPTSLAGYLFRVVATNVCASTSSSGVSLAVATGNPSILTQPASTNICNGNNHVFTVSTPGSLLTYTWQYFFSSTWFSVIGTVGANGTVSGSSLTLNSTAGFLLDDDNIRVVVSNACGTATSDGLAILNNITSPTITTAPSSATACGTNVIFSVAANANGGTNSFSWQLSTNSGIGWIAVSNGGNYAGATTSGLTVSGISSTMNGFWYRVAVSNGCFTTTSLSATLSVSANSTWLGLVNNDWFNSGNWCSVPTTTANSAIIPAGTTFMPIITASSINIGGISLASGASLTISGSNTLTLSGNLINNGTIVPNSSTIVWNGSVAQTISGTGTNQFTNLFFRNTTGVTIGSTVSVSGTASFNSNARLTINSGATMVLQSSASGTARISSMPSGATITGNITMQRYVPAKPTVRLMSSAVNGATVADWKNSIPVSGIGGTGNGFDASVANINTVWYFNETINAPTTYRYVGAPNTSMALTPGAGYRVYVRGDRNFINLMGTITITNVTMGVTNRPNQGNISLPVSYTNYNAPFRDGTNLVGNPYPCEINWDAAGWTKTNIDNALYMWDPNLGTNGSYYYYVAGVASPARTNPGIIASSQGFFVKANAASPVLIATESVKTIAGHTANFRTSNEVPDVVRVQLKDQTGLFDEMAVRFHPNATKAFDKDFDAFKIYNSNLNVFARPNAQSDLSINSFALDNSPYVLPLVVSASKKGNYTLAFSGLESISQPTDIYISDRYMASYAKLDEGSTYDITFNSDTSSTSLNRFALVFMRSSVTTGLEAAVSGAKPSVEIFPNPVNDNELHLNLYQWEGKSVAISIKNAAGQLLFNQQVKVENPFVSSVVPVAQHWAEGVYIIQCVGDGFQDTKKIIIQK